jgi:hypothetical protein
MRGVSFFATAKLTGTVPLVLRFPVLPAPVFPFQPEPPAGLISELVVFFLHDTPSG